jgi:myo-inositol-1(or 4)-monophosphatase
MSEFGELLSIATKAAASAGAALRDNRDKWSIVEGVDGREVKLLADREAESAVLAVLSPTGLSILSEEAGNLGNRDLESGLAWAVDPLDGSVNYFRGSSYCAVSVALLHDGRPIVGVVDCFLLGEVFTGIDGEGAWLNGEPMRVSTITDPMKSILQTGVPARAAPETYARVAARLPNWQKIRMIGSAATALAHVAAGRAEVYRESGSMIWDVAAGCALVAAAGGQFEIDAAPIGGPREVAAGNGLIEFPD